MSKKQKRKAIRLSSKYKVLIVAGLLLLTPIVMFFMWSKKNLPTHSGNQGQTSHTPVVTKEKLEKIHNKPDSSTESSTKPVIAASSGVKDKDTHASAILRQKDYPQYRYIALATPNDPNVSGSWYHTKVQSNRAWDVSTGSGSTVIAVIDSGFALDHEDLTGKWKTNAGEQGNTTLGGVCWTGVSVSKTTNNCDDDQNGYVDDWRGWDFNANDNDVQTGTVNPAGNGTQHGTLVSGIIAATTNNSLGNAGLDWQAKVMPLQALSDDGEGYTYDIVSAIEYAVNNGANIINLSLGGDQFDQALLDAVVYARSQGVLVVAASGNCGDSSTDICANLTAPGRMAYPAKFTQVLSVGATTSGDVRSSFSSYGPELDMVAPGSAIGPLASWSSVYPTNGYVSSASGTSFASPIVAGIAGIVRSRLGNPSVDQLTSVLTASTDKIGDLTNQNKSDMYGFGRVNAHKATILAKAISVPPGNVGTSEIQSRQPARGGITRSTTGSVSTDEWVVVACRVEVSDSCSSVITNGASTQRINPIETSKGASVYYMFVKGSSLNSGTSTISVHNRNYASTIGTLVK